MSEHPNPGSEPLPPYGTPGTPFGSPQGAPGHPPFGTPGEPPREPAGTPGARFFDGIRSYGAVRPAQGRWAAGVCAALARRWNMSPGAVRLLFVLFSLVSGVGLAAYGVLWLLLPHPDGRIHAQQALAGTFTAGFFGGLLAVLVDHPFAGWHDGPWHRPSLLPLLLVAGLVWWLVTRSGHRTHPGSR